MNNSKITILASYVTELIFHVPRIMKPGETIEGSFETGYGGKGFNMAVAAKRAGGEVNVIMKVGNDVFGDTAIRLLNEEGIDTGNVRRDEVKSSGAGVVLLMPDGENAIAIDSGANTTISTDEIDASATDLRLSSVILSPLEVPVAAVQRAFEITKSAGCITILNPAPARELPDQLYRLIDIITPNETEAEILTGIELKTDIDVIVAADKLLAKGAGSVVITRGPKKVYYKDSEESAFLYPPAIDVVDTTGAGDAFNGALAYSIAGGNRLADAVMFAIQYSAMKVTRKGTSKAMPYKTEFESYMKIVNNSGR